MKKNSYKIKMCKKNVFWIISVFILTLISWFFLYDKNGIRQNSEETEIGVILPLTGDWGGFGHRMKNGILLWKKQNPNARVNIHIEDGMGKANNSISAFNKLISVNMINACITGVSPVVLGLAPVAEKKEIFLINAGATNPDIKKSSDYVFTLIPDADVEAAYIADFLLNSLKKTECFVYWKNDDSGKGMLDSFSKFYIRNGGSIKGNAAITSMDDIKNTLSKIQSLKVKTVFVPTNGEMIAKIINQAYKLGLNDILWVGYAATESPELKNDLAFLKDVKLIFSSYSFDGNKAFSEKSRQFINDYQAEFGEVPAYYSATCYDAISLIYDALKNYNGDSKSIKKYIYNLKSYNGVSGNFHIDGKNYVTSGLSFKMFNNGHIMPINIELYK